MTIHKLPVNGTATARDFLTVAEVCAELGVARSTFYDWRAAHKGPHGLKLPNGEVRIRRDELDRWLKRLEEMALRLRTVQQRFTPGDLM
jgi:excisionase family DNA binding protein